MRGNLRAHVTRPNDGGFLYSKHIYFITRWRNQNASAFWRVQRLTTSRLIPKDFGKNGNGLRIPAVQPEDQSKATSFQWVKTERATAILQPHSPGFESEPAGSSRRQSYCSGTEIGLAP
jgi:hypothetical protein